jgi:hypothetical protein
MISRSILGSFFSTEAHRFLLNNKLVGLAGEVSQNGKLKIEQHDTVDCHPVSL